MNVTQKDFRAAKDCIVLSNGIVDIVVSVKFGPRILFYGHTAGQNFFQVFDEQIKNFKKEEWQIYGGHRLWLAPEEQPRSYYIDNTKIEHSFNDNVLTLTAPIEKATGVQKIIEMKLEASSTKVEVTHIIINHNLWDIELSAWSLSVMNEGGTVIIPQEDYKPHPQYLMPARPLVLWPFTDMSDPRFTWGKKYIQMRQDNAHDSKLKIGVANTKACVAYSLNDEVFIKKHKHILGAEYPDMGSNSEFFTMPDFLEVETLSPLTRLKPKEELRHYESWEIKKMKVGKDENTFDAIFD